MGADSTKHFLYSKRIENTETEEYYSIYKSFIKPLLIKESSLYSIIR